MGDIFVGWPNCCWDAAAPCSLSSGMLVDLSWFNAADVLFLVPYFWCPKLRPLWGVRPYGERVRFCFLIATILADKAAIISLWSPWQSKDIGADGIMLLVAVEPENTSRTVRCVLLYREGGAGMIHWSSANLARQIQRAVQRRKLDL